MRVSQRDKQLGVEQWTDCHPPIFQADDKREAADPVIHMQEYEENAEPPGYGLEFCFFLSKQQTVDVTHTCATL